jgi:hypothetical protein
MPAHGKNERFLESSRRINFYGEWHINGLDLTHFHDLVGSS